MNFREIFINLKTLRSLTNRLNELGKSTKGWLSSHAVSKDLGNWEKRGPILDFDKTYANVRTVQFDNGLMGGLKYQTGRYTFTTRAAMRSFNFTEPLPSGLLGPVEILTTNLYP